MKKAYPNFDIEITEVEGSRRAVLSVHVRSFVTLVSPEETDKSAMNALIDHVLEELSQLKKTKGQQEEEE